MKNAVSNAYKARRAQARNERGEGVISLAIGVLIMSFLGAGMWVAFNGTMVKAQTNVDTQVTEIGAR